MPTAPFGILMMTQGKLLYSQAKYSTLMLACLELPHISFHQCATMCTIRASGFADLAQMGRRSRQSFAEAAADTPNMYTVASDVQAVLQQFYDDPYAQQVKRHWLVNDLQVPRDAWHDAEHMAGIFESAAETFF